MSAQSMAAWAGFGLTIVINLMLGAFWFGKRQGDSDQDGERIEALESRTERIEQGQHELRNLLIAFMLGLEEMPNDMDDSNKLLRMVARARAERRTGEA